jgi:hypothetical protein
MFNPNRDQVRRFFFDAWRKHRDGAVLTDLEHMAVDLIVSHPEYHVLLQDEEATLSRDYLAETGEHNPFLHLSLHLAIAEQLSIDQPPGLRAAYDRLLARSGNRHDALHAILECLGETVWQAQRDGRPPDGEAYLECVRKRMH